MRRAKTVLVVEDDDALREELAENLRADGYRVIALEDGFELCDYLELTLDPHARVPPPDLIVSDVELPGLGGLQICRTLSRAEGSMPFILLAPDDDPEHREEAEQSGAAHVLAKPVNLVELYAAIAGLEER
jgi:DNA-binding response OmpR family regulator